MKKLLLGVALLCLAGSARAQSAVGGLQASAPINISTAATVIIIPANGARTTAITQINLDSAGSSTETLEYGTGAACAGGTVVLAGPWTLSATLPPVVIGDGFGAVWTVPAGNNVCILQSAAVTVAGSVSYNYTAGT